MPIQVPDLPVCQFLQLPRELRDHIYIHYLFEPKGIFYYRDHVHQSRFTRSEKDEAGINQLKFTCRQLRAETRGLEVDLNNLIFLREDSRARNSNDNVGLQPEPGIENTEYISKPPAVQLLGFLDMCNESLRLRLRHIQLQDTKYSILHCDKIYILDIHLIVYYCQRYPNLTVLWHAEISPLVHGSLDDFEHSRPSRDILASTDTSDPASFLDHGLLWMSAFRSATKATLLAKELNLPNALANSYLKRNLPMRWRAGCDHRFRCCDCHISARNFRFVPVEDNHQWHVRFRRWLMECEVERSPAMIDRYVAVAKDWVQNGM